MSLQKPGQPLSKRSALQTYGLVLLVLALAASGRFAWQKYRTHPLSAAETRGVIRDYFEKKAGVSGFKPPEIDESTTNPPLAEVFQPAEGAARKSGKEKKKKSRSPYEQVARDFRQSIKKSPDYQSTYRLIGDHLAQVDRLLAAPDPERTEAALLFASEAGQAALDPAVDGWLAARIAEAYLWPNLQNAPKKNDLDAEGLLDLCEDAFKAADETENLIRNYELLIAQSDRSKKADKLRVRLAKLLESQEYFAEALRVLRSAQDTNNPTLVRRISTVEMLLKQSKSAH